MSEGPLIPRTSVCFQYEVSAAHNLPRSQPSLVRRFQGLSLPVHLRVSEARADSSESGMRWVWTWLWRFEEHAFSFSCVLLIVFLGSSGFKTHSFRSKGSFKEETVDGKIKSNQDDILIFQSGRKKWWCTEAWGACEPVRPPGALDLLRRLFPHCPYFLLKLFLSLLCKRWALWWLQVWEIIGRMHPWMRSSGPMS